MPEILRLFSAMAGKPRARSLPIVAARRLVAIPSQPSRSQTISRGFSSRSPVDKEIGVVMPKFKWPVTRSQSDLPRRIFSLRRLTIGMILATLSGSYLFYRSLVQPVPITNRKRLLWYSAEDWGTSGYDVQQHMLSQAKKSKYTDDSQIVQVAREILNRLLEVDVVKGLNIKLFVFNDIVDGRASSTLYHPTPNQSGGLIFINTGELRTCETIDDVAAVLGHELAHILANHISEARTSRWIATEISKAFGYKGSLPLDRATSRVHESEADHIGLILMSRAGFDPQAVIDYMAEQVKGRLLHEDGNLPRPEFLSTHPSYANRLSHMESVLPEAKAIFENKGHLKASMAPLAEKWKTSKMYLAGEYKKHKEKERDQEKLKPANMLRDINSRLDKLEYFEERLMARINQINEVKCKKENQVAGTGAESTARASNNEPKSSPAEIAPVTAELKTSDTGKNQEKGKESASGKVAITKETAPNGTQDLPIEVAPVAVAAPSTSESGQKTINSRKK